MKKQVIITGLLGGLVLTLWAFVVNGVFGFQARIDMKQIPQESLVYQTLKQHITLPGRYICNPDPTSQERFPEGEPVFSILYGGVGHEWAGKGMLIGLAIYFLAPWMAAWMLAQASGRVLTSYSRKVLYFAGIGLLIAMVSDLPDFGIGGYPLRDTALLAANHLISWTLVGVAAAWRIRPETRDS